MCRGSSEVGRVRGSKRLDMLQDSRYPGGDPAGGSQDEGDGSENEHDHQEISKYPGDRQIFDSSER